IFLNVSSPRSYAALLGHEWSHTLENLEPDLYRELQAQLKPLVDDWRKRAAELTGKAYTEGQSESELTGNIVGDAVNNPEFWRLIAERNKPLFRRVLASFQRWFDRLRGKALKSEWGTEAFITQLDAAHRAILNTMQRSVGIRQQRPVTWS